MFNRVMEEVETRWRLRPRADAQMCEEKLEILLRNCVCLLPSSGGGDAAYITEQHLNLGPVRFHKVHINAASARAARCQGCFLVPAGSCFLPSAAAGMRLAHEWVELHLSAQEH